MKSMMKKALLTVSATTTLMTTMAHANTYICLGVDENDGVARVNTAIDRNQPVKPFGHVNGQEVRMIEMEGRLSLTINKNDGKFVVIVAMPGGLLFQDGSINLNCVPAQR